MKKWLRLNETMPDFITNGIFQTMEDLEVSLPWDDVIDNALLDLDYHANNGGLRVVAPIIDYFIEQNATTSENPQILTAEQRQQLATIILGKYKDNWKHIWDSYFDIVYEPLENYDRTEVKTGTETGLETPTDWKETETQTPTNWTETETQTPTNWTEKETQTPTNWKETETQTPTNWKQTETQTPSEWITETKGEKNANETETEQNVYGFDSTNPVPSNKEVTRTGSDVTTEQSGTFETETEQSGTFETEKEQSGTFETEREQSGTFETKKEQTGTFEVEKTQSGTMENKMTYNTTLRVHGNIGVTTSQQMLQSELELRKYDFFQQVYSDINKILTIEVF